LVTSASGVTGQPGQAAGPKRNGGRHCCQPPLRRAKDLPNLLNQVPGEPNPRTPTHQLRRRFPPATPSEEEPGDLYSSAPAEASLLFRAARPDPKVKADRCSAALLGMNLNRVPLCPPRPKSVEAASRNRKNISSGASSRLASESPEGTFHCPPRRSELWPPAEPSKPLPALRWGLGPPSRSPNHHAHVRRVAKAKNVGASLWITWISGKRRGTFLTCLNGRSAGCRFVPPRLPRPSA